MNISHYGFVCPVNCSKEKYTRVKRTNCKKKNREKIDIRYSWIIREYFLSDKYYSYSYLQVLELTNYSYSYLYRSMLQESIPIYGKNTICWSLLWAALCDSRNFFKEAAEIISHCIINKHMTSNSSYIICLFPDFFWSIKSIATFGLDLEVLLCKYLAEVKLS